MKQREQIERIQKMEQLMDKALEAISQWPLSPDEYTEIQQAIYTLSSYYTSNKWKQDYADDEAGLLPKDLKRGVLSEDGIWNLFIDWEVCHSVRQ